MLHPRARMLLDLVAKGIVPETHTLTPPQARAMYLERRALSQPAAPEVARVLDLQADGPHGAIPLRLYWPIAHAADEVLPALVYFHGGGWTMGDLETHDVLCRELCNGAACAVVAVDYFVETETERRTSET